MVSIARRRRSEGPETSPDFVWQAPPEIISLDGRDVHVWRVLLDLESTELLGLWAILSPEEQARASRFHFSTDRSRFIAARGTLRTILGLYLDESPGELTICSGPFGKPYLARSSLRFNVSHSDGIALIALTDGREVGIDLEHVRPQVDHESIASRFFSPAESAKLGALPQSRRSWAFLACWTRKEAYVKAKGGGLSIPLEKFDVSLESGGPARLVNVHFDPGESARWSLAELTPGPGSVGALCVEGTEPHLCCWQWSHRSGPAVAVKRLKEERADLRR